MSAQFGKCYFDGKPLDPQELDRVRPMLARYGPDAEGSFHQDNVGILYRASYTTKESRNERQPYRSVSGKVVTWDGRLDNRQDLLTQLPARDFTSEITDLSIVVSAFERWGILSFRELVGDWAVSVWDPVEKKLVFATDRIGFRHVYYYLTPNFVLWCTFLEPLLALAASPLTINDEYVAGYLASAPAAHLSPYNEIGTVPPRSAVTIRNGKAEVFCYFYLKSAYEIRYKNDAEYEDHFRFMFRQSVKRRLRSESPVLAELSGGVDSSAIVCVADDIFARGDIETPRVDTISFLDTRQPAPGQLPYISLIEARRGRGGHHVDIAQHGDDFFSAGAGELLTAPGCSKRHEGTRGQIFEHIEKYGYRVVLSGIGGDEFLGAQPDPWSQLADLIVVPRPVKLLTQLRSWSDTTKRHWAKLLCETLARLLSASLFTALTGRPNVEPWIATQFATRHRVRIKKMGPQSTCGFWRPSRQQYGRAVVSMSRRFALSGSRSLGAEEKRYPFLDQQLLEFLASIPASQLARPNQSRSLLRRALRDIVPCEVLSRNKSADASPSLRVSFQANWSELEKLFAAPLSASMGYLDKARILTGLTEARNGGIEEVANVAKAVFLELWLQGLNQHGIIFSGSNGTVARNASGHSDPEPEPLNQGSSL
jgi:asparagine synthase (glutamine-hydrolysing)